MTSQSILKLSRLAIFNYRSIRPNSTKPAEDNRPVVYTQSAANKWKAQYTREGGRNTRLWYEPYVVLTSIAVFLIYFCILREESDIDRKFDKSLYDHIEGLEERQLIISLNYNQEHGLDTKAIVTRLEELAKDNKKE